MHTPNVGRGRGVVRTGVPPSAGMTGSMATAASPTTRRRAKGEREGWLFTGVDWLASGLVTGVVGAGVDVRGTEATWRVGVG